MNGKLGGGIEASQQRRCDHRRRLAALNHSVEAAPIRIFQAASDQLRPGSGTLRYASGELPSDEAEALATLNRGRTRAGFGGLKADQVYVHYLEAANSNYIGDRFMFLDETTLRNIVRGAEGGFAFMNSHRTGGLSTPTELPFGRAFAGRYEEHEDDGHRFKRAVVGVYMIRGQRPNGSSGPSTDDLHDSIEGGTLTDVSMGLTGGKRVCDLCGVDVEEEDEDGDYVCPHVPGTHKHLNDEQRESQSVRGAGDGVASYSLVGASPQEVSAVYKGAVPGAGFRKAVGLSSRRGLGIATGREIVSAYGPMLTQGERTRLGGEPMAKKRFSLGDLFRTAEEAPEDLDEIELAIIERPQEGRGGANGNTPGGSRADDSGTPPAVPEALMALLPEKERNLAIREAKLDARDYLAGLKGKFSPHEEAGITSAYILAYVDDIERPVLDPFTNQPVKRVDILKRTNEHRAGFKFSALASGKEEIGDTPVLREGERALPSVPAGIEDSGQDMDATFALAATTPAGIVALKDTPEGRAWCQKRGL